MLVDIICEASFGVKLGVLQARTYRHREHYLVRAIDDFPKAGVLVRFQVLKSANTQHHQA